MKIADKKTMLIQFINTILNDKNDEYYLLSPELNGNINVGVGTKKKQYQYISGDICIPHSLLKEEHKENFNIISNLSMNMFTFIKKEYVNEQVDGMVEKSEDYVNAFLTNNPEVDKALNDLMTALKSAKY
jgi:uncharacterized protein (DUF1015 family)